MNSLHRSLDLDQLDHSEVISLPKPKKELNTIEVRGHSGEKLDLLQR